MDECDRYWAYADHLPLDQVVTYWCEKSGISTENCREARKAAILKACSDGDLAYRRTDGKTFADPVDDLAARGLIAINRDSFESWVTENFATETPLPNKATTTRQRNTYLTIIAALCDYSDIRIGERGAAVQIARLTEEYGAPVTDDTIRSLLAEIPGATASRKK